MFTSKCFPVGSTMNQASNGFTQLDVCVSAARKAYINLDRISYQDFLDQPYPESLLRRLSHAVTASRNHLVGFR